MNLINADSLLKKPQVRGARLRSNYGGVLWSAGAVIVSIALIGPLSAIAGADAAEAYRVLWERAIGSTYGFGNTLRMATPLLLVSIAVAIPYRARLFNLGGEGQLLIGALGAHVVASHIDALPSFGPILPLVAGALAAGAFAAIAGCLRSFRGANEIVTTLMLTFIALYLVQYLVSGPMRDPEAAFSTTRAVGDDFRMGSVGEQFEIPIGFFLAVVAGALVWYVCAFARVGERLSITGDGLELAHRQGVNTRRYQLWALVIGGGFAGLAGACELLGNQYRLGQEFSPGWGWSAIAIAILARGNVLGAMAIAILFAGLANGGQALNEELAVPSGMILMLQAVPVIALAAIFGVRGLRNKPAKVLDPQEVDK